MPITNLYTQKIPATRFIGRKYGDADRVNGSFGQKWGEAHGSDLFGTIERAVGVDSAPFFEDSGAYIGLMRVKDGEPFEYWIGIFTPADTVVPEGLSHVDFPAATLGVGWVCGPEWEIYGHEQDVLERLNETGHVAATMPDGGMWFMERYTCPRFTCPDEQGRVTLDVCFFVSDPT